MKIIIIKKFLGVWSLTRNWLQIHLSHRENASQKQTTAYPSIKTSNRRRLLSAFKLPDRSKINRAPMSSRSMFAKAGLDLTLWSQWQHAEIQKKIITINKYNFILLVAAVNGWQPLHWFCRARASCENSFPCQCQIGY